MSHQVLKFYRMRAARPKAATPTTLALLDRALPDWVAGAPVVEFEAEPLGVDGPLAGVVEAAGAVGVAEPDAGDEPVGTAPVDPPAGWLVRVTPCDENQSKNCKRKNGTETYNSCASSLGTREGISEVVPCATLLNAIRRAGDKGLVLAETGVVSGLACPEISRSDAGESAS